MNTQAIELPPSGEAAAILLPDPGPVFLARAERFDALALHHGLGEWLAFLGRLSRAQHAALEASAQDIAALGLTAPIVGHVGDGNFHALPLFDPADPEEVGRIKTFVRNLVERAIAMGGTCTGEHGVGQGKMSYLALEFPPGTLAMMRAIKAAVDPRGIMNPGKIV